MKRLAEQFLADWYAKSNRKPLIIRGARQVGKSTLIRQFADKNKINLIEINLEKTRDKISFASNNAEKILHEIEVYTQKKISSDSSLLFIDEIQESPAAIEALRYLFEEKPNLAVVAAGSLLEFTLNEHNFSMPVGRVEFYYLGPMLFSEYLEASGESNLLARLEDHPLQAATQFHAHLTERLHEYYFLGGMPEVIAQYLKDKSFLQAREIQQSILETYRLDFPKYSNKNQSIRLSKLLDRIIHFIGKKVKYTELLADEKHPAIRKAIELLKDAKLIHCCYHTNATSIPLATTSDESVFKIYLLDIGLMNALLEIEWNEIKENLNTKGNQAEQFIAQHLAYQQPASPQLYYWLRNKKSGNAEVDFIFKHKSEIIPIEVKAGKSGKIRSLDIIMQEKKLKRAVRFDLKQRNKDEWIEEKSYTLYNLPIFLAEWMRKALDIKNLMVLFLILNFTTNAFAKTLTLRLESAPSAFDYNVQSAMGDAPIILNTQEGLFRQNLATHALVPAIASDVKKSKNLKEYTFTINKDAKWSDGRPIYAQDFVYGWLRAISPQSTSIYTYYFFDIVNAQEYNQKKIDSASEVGIKAIDDHTLVVKLNKPESHWEIKTAFWPFFAARKDLIEKFGAQWSRPGVIVSSGPFVIDSYEENKKFILKRNLHYRKMASNIDQVELQIIPDFKNALKSYEAKKTDILTSIPFSNVVENSKRKDSKKIPLLRVYAFIFNTDRYPLNNKKFRLALLKALDTKKIIPTSMSNLTHIQSLIPGSLGDRAYKIPLSLDLKEAKKLLNESGVVLNSKLKIQLITGLQEPSLSIARNIQTQLLNHLGVNIEVNTYEGQEFSTVINLGEYNGYVTTWTGKLHAAADFLLPYSGFAINNRAHYFNPVFDNFIEQSLEAHSKSEQIKLLNKAQKLITADEGIILPLCTEQPVALIRASVSELYFDQMGVPQLMNVNLH